MPPGSNRTSAATPPAPGTVPRVRPRTGCKGSTSESGGEAAGSAVDAILALVREEIGDAKFGRWFGPQLAVSLSGESGAGAAADATLLLTAATPYLLKFVQTNYRDILRDAAAEVLGRAVPIEGSVAERSVVPTIPLPDAAASGSDRPGLVVEPAEDGAAKPHFDLADFVVGPCNQVGHVAATRFVEDPGLAFGPLMFIGPVGSGKSHLLFGLAAAVKDSGRGRVLSMTAVHFCNLFKQSLRDGSTASFRNRFNSVRVLCLDDVDFFDGTRSFQAELLQTIERLEQQGVRFVMTCGVNPQTLTNLSDELISRLLSGIVCRLERACQPVRRKVATAHVRRLKADLSAEAVRYAADRCDGSVRQVIGAVQTLDAEARVLGKKLGVTRARQVVAQLTQSRRKVVRLTEIEAAVSRLFGVTGEELRSSARARRVSRPRHVAMSLARTLTSAAYHEIGEHFGGRNHSTVMAAERTVRKMVETDETLRVGCNDLTAADVLARLESELRAG